MQEKSSFQGVEKMQSSYNFITKNQALSGNSKTISTEYIKKRNSIKEELQDSGKRVEEIQELMDIYESIGKNIILDAQRKRDEFMIEAIARSEAMEKEAYEKGYNQGLDNGFEDGKNEAIEKFFPEAERRAEELVRNAENILSKAEDDYYSYMESKKEEIIRLSLTIAKQVLKREVTSEGGLSDLVEEAIELSKGEDNVIIKCNHIHEEEIREKIPVWKANYSIKGEIFVLAKDGIEVGNAFIEKSSGKMQVGIDIGLEEIEKAILP